MANIPISERTARDFGHLVTRLAELNDLSQSEMASRAGISRQFVSQITRGYIPSPDVLQKLARVLRVAYFTLWEAAYDEIVPEGYVVEALDGRSPADLPLATFLARHPPLARIIHAYLELPEGERERTAEFLEAALYGRRATKR